MQPKRNIQSKISNSQAGEGQMGIGYSHFKLHFNYTMVENYASRRFNINIWNKLEKGRG